MQFTLQIDDPFVAKFPANGHPFDGTKSAVLGSCRFQEGDGVRFPDDVDLEMRATPIGDFCLRVES